MSISHFISKLSPRQISIIRTLIVPVEYLILFLDLIYPKNDKLIIFGSNTGEYASGSPHAMYQYIQNHQPEYDVNYYLPFARANFREQLGYITNFLPKFLGARFLISSHPTTDFFPFSWSKRKKLINVWHGVPLKSLFYTDSGDTAKNLKKIDKMAKQTSILTVSSRLESALITECMLIDPRKIRVTGHPRNDALMGDEEDNNEKSKIREILGDLIQDQKIILYAPTFRREEKIKFFPFQDLDTEDLNQFLEENNSIILIRGHVYSKMDASTDIFTDRIIDFGFDICSDVNSILGEVDILITDYSSIYVDYLILKRPCIFIPYDLEEYKKGRGLLLDDYDFWAPGPKVLTYDEFINSLKQIIDGEDNYQKRRNDIFNQFHYHTDAKSCQRLFELIREL